MSAKTIQALASDLYFFVPILIVLFVFIFGKKINRLIDFRHGMIKNMKPALIISFVFYFGYAIGEFDVKYLLNIQATLIIFCTSALGLTLARSISGYEPLPVTTSFVKKKDRTKQILLMMLFSAIIVILNIIVGSVGMGVCLSLFHETAKTSQAINMLPKNKILSFILLLSGAGIAEEGMYRLLFLSLFWKLLKKPWVAIILSSLCFALYHLTPLDEMYQVYWQYPLSLVTTVFLGGLLFGLLYKKRGFETCVLGHTLYDYIGVLFNS